MHCTRRHDALMALNNKAIVLEHIFAELRNMCPSSALLGTREVWRKRVIVYGTVLFIYIYIYILKQLDALSFWTRHTLEI